MDEEKEKIQITREVYDGLSDDEIAEYGLKYNRNVEIINNKKEKQK